MKNKDYFEEYFNLSKQLRYKEHYDKSLTALKINTKL